jgi:hypothetical protein
VGSGGHSASNIHQMPHASSSIMPIPITSTTPHATLRHKVSRCSLTPPGNSLPDLSFGWTFLHQTRIGLLNDHEEGWCMSSYATYCRDQATDCARRARLAKSADIAIYYEGLGLRWLNLAEHAQGTGGVVAQASEAISASSLLKACAYVVSCVASSLIEFAEGNHASTQGAAQRWYAT